MHCTAFPLYQDQVVVVVIALKGNTRAEGWILRFGVRARDSSKGRVGAASAGQVDVMLQDGETDCLSVDIWINC